MEAQRVRKKEDQRAVLLKMRGELGLSQETRAKKMPMLPLYHNLNKIESQKNNFFNKGNLIQETSFEKEVEVLLSYLRDTLMREL